MTICPDDGADQTIECLTWGGSGMKRNKLLTIISIVLAIAALTLIIISIVGHFESNWVLTAGLACVLIGNILNFIRIRKKDKERDAQS